MRHGRAAIACAALAVPVTVLLGSAVAWYYKTRNPDDVDITAGLAYLRQILLTTFGAFLVMAVLTIVLAVFGLRRDDDPALARLALVLLAAVTACGLLAGVASSRAGDAEHRYRQQHSASP